MLSHHRHVFLLSPKTIYSKYFSEKTLFLGPEFPRTLFEWRFPVALQGVGKRPGLRGESLEAVRSVGEQQGFPAHVHPDAGAAALLLHAWPRIRGLTHHDGASGAAGVRHRHPQTPAVGSHWTQPGEQEPSQTSAAQVNSLWFNLLCRFYLKHCQEGRVEAEKLRLLQEKGFILNYNNAKQRVSLKGWQT